MLKITKIYYRTNTGKSWKSKPAETITETITRREYENYVESVSFMNGFCGGRARAYKLYDGGPVYKIVLVAPNNTEKHIEIYKF